MLKPRLLHSPLSRLVTECVLLKLIFISYFVEQILYITIYTQIFTFLYTKTNGDDFKQLHKDIL
jgi:hypothetical protein